MSHTLDFETVVTDPQALVRALKRMGVPEQDIEIHEIAVRLNTYHEEEHKIAHVIVRRNLGCDYSHRNSDVGWEHNDEGVYVGHIDEFDYQNRTCFDKDWQQKLYTYYNVEATKIAFENKGMDYVETKDKAGRIQLRAKFAKATAAKSNKIKIHATR